MDFYQHLEKSFDKETIKKLKNSFQDYSKHAVLLNLNKINDSDFLKTFPNVIKHPLIEHAYIYDEKEYQLGKSLYHLQGAFYIQDPSAMMVSSLIDFNENDLVLDMCAAPGGKSIQAALKMNNKGLVISNDLSKDRCNSIVENIEKMGITNIVVTNNDLSKLYTKYLTTFDKIILDAPCSGSGMFRKDPKFIEDWNINKVYKYAQIQKNLIQIAYQMLKPGGILLYSTCSYSYEENEDVIESLLSKYSMKLISIKSSPLLYVNKNKPYGVHMLSGLFPGEGQYVCLLQKAGETNNTKFIQNKNQFSKTLPLLNRYQIQKYGDYLFGISNLINLNGFNIIRNGFKIGELSKDNLIKYDYNLSHVLSDFENKYEMNESEVQQYILGNVINVPNLNKGYVLLSYKNIALSFGKSDGNIIKNHFPKGLRKKYLLY